ncbi:MAG: hypothetical protein HS103_07875 [Anaerolineales bacterium]|nr:hypothetical protein [Anaerolineales bacterium]
MPDQPFTPFQVHVHQRKEEKNGIDFHHAYRALIKGFVRAKTSQHLKDTEQELEERQKG